LKKTSQNSLSFKEISPGFLSVPHPLSMEQLIFNLAVLWFLCSFAFRR